TSFGLQSLTINISHPADEQLTLQLESPDGALILLAKNLPGSDYTNTKFDALSSVYIDFGSAPYNSSFRPLQDLSFLNNFQNPNGTWNLKITDNTAGITGTVNSVSLEFGSKPAKPLLSSSTLPIVKIYTHGQEILDDPKIIADMYIINNGPGTVNYLNQTNYDYQGKIGIEIRGQSSQQFPKKQFGFETRKANGIDDEKVSILGMPEESDWILSANYTDKTLMRNVLTYELAREMGQYAARTRYCEVLINDEYKGVFVLQEKIKRDKNRINIEKLSVTNITAPGITGGYIFSIDKINGGEITWHSKISGSSTIFQFVYPKKPEDIAPEQNDYLQNYVDSFEQALDGPEFQNPLTGFRNYAEEKSFMQYFIINELAKNIDGFRVSNYFHKARNGKIVAGPVWDFDVAWGNANYFQGNNPTGYVYSYSYPPDDYQVPFWWRRLRSDVLWNQNLICTYNNLRLTTLSQSHINSLIDSIANELQDAQQRNFIRWNIIGQYIWPNPSPIPTSYAGEIDYLKNFIAARVGFLDADFGPCAVLPIELNNFSAIPEKTNIKLKWTTQYESGNDYFVVERAANNESFTGIGIVKAQNSSAGSAYVFEDGNLADGTINYRLKQVNMDASFTYSKIISIKFKNAQWHIYPAKVRDQLTIISPFTNVMNLQTNIYNMQGQKISSENTINNNVIHKDVSRLSSGIYILEIIPASGDKTILRFVKD
ncbi:MAG: CotH kinase family protein, partial [Ginsengibacter sp.]